jgi:two-component system NtrC family sensor kinase
MTLVDLASYAALHMLAAAYAAALALWVMLRGERAAGMSFALVCLPVALALGAAGFMMAAPDAARAADWGRRSLALSLLGGAAIPALVVTSVTSPGAQSRLVAGGYALAATLGLGALFSGRFVAGVVRGPIGFERTSGSLSLAPPAFLLGCGAASLALLARAAGRARPGGNRARIMFLLGGTLGLWLGALTLAAPAPTLALRAAPFLVAGGLTILAYALAAGSPAAASSAALGTIAWTVTSALAFVPVYGLVQVLRRLTGFIRPGAEALVLAALFVLLSLYFREVQPRIDRLFRRGRPPVREELAAFAARALDLRTQAEMARDLDALLGRVAGVRLRALYVRSGGEWRAATASGLPAPPLDPPLDPAGPVTRYLAEQRTAVGRHLEPAGRDDAPGPAGARLLASRLSADALVPLVHRDELCGLVAVVADGGMGRAELATLSQLRTDIGTAALNAALYERARRLETSLEENVGARREQMERTAHDLAEAERRLVQQEKMSALGLLAHGVGHQIGEALGLIGGNLPNLKRYLEIYEGVIARHRAVLADAPRAEPPALLEQTLRIEHIRRDAPALVSAIEEGTRRACSIATDLKRFASPDDSPPVRIDVRERLEMTLNLLAAEMKNRIRVHRDYAAAVPAVLAHVGQLDQVFMNLLVNALQAVALQAGGEVWVGVEVAPGGEVLVTLRDSGPGVPEGIRDRIFEPFFTTKPVGQGTGLGLAISYGIVERHGGRIELAAPEPGRAGACFRVLLPPAPAEAVA